MSDEVSFEEQLRQEQLAKVKEDEETAERSLGELYTDKDGIDYEWDAAKKAWFPKIDADFIARYQMSYGVDNDSTTATSTETENKGPSQDPSQDPSKDPSQYSGKDYEEYCKQYYDYYYGQGQGQDGEHAATSGDPNYDYYRYHGYDMSEYYGPQEGEEKQGEEEEEEKSEKMTKEEKKKESERKRKEPPTWFQAEPDHLPNVYVSGMPTDVTEEEFIDIMSKCGLIVHDHETRKPKVKLYRTKEGGMKGDGLCCYIKQESVELALQILDESDVRGNTISVERAKFELKGDFDASKRRKKLSNKQKRKLKERQEKLFSWTPEKKEVTRGKNEKVVVLQHVFDPKEFETEPTLINEIRADMRSECTKFGEVRKVAVHDRNPDGVVSIFFKTPEEADQCIAALNGRWFAGRQLTAATWDGKTKYDLEESEEEKAKRLAEWARYLETGEEKKIGDNTEQGKETGATTTSQDATPPPSTEAPKSSNTEEKADPQESSTTPTPDQSTSSTENNEDSKS